MGENENNEVVYLVKESIMNDVFSRLGHIVHPTILYTGDELGMAKRVIAENKGQAESIKELLASQWPEFEQKADSFC